MKVIFFLPGGVVEYPIAEELQPNFNFNATAVAFRTNGFFISESLYLRHSQIIGMALQMDDGPPAAVRRDLN